MDRDICIDRLRKRAVEHKSANAYLSQKNGEWIATSWHEYHQQVRQFAKALIALGLKPDAKIAILGFNKLEWVVSAIGAQYAGGVSVGVYTSSSKDEVAYVVDHCDAEILVVENIERLKSQVGGKASFPKLKKIVLMSDERAKDSDVVAFSEFLKSGEAVSDEDLDKRQGTVDADSVATMIYTSGTTGHPKSVMLSHHAIAWTVRTVVQSWSCSPADTSVSYLPLAHVAEQMFTLYAPIECGMQSHFATSFEALKKNLAEVQPTILFGVPRVFEKMYDAVKSGLESRGPVLRKVLGHLMGVTNEYYAAKHASRMPSLLTNLQYQVARAKLFSKLKEKMGFKNMRICISGAAPISNEILHFFTGLDIPIYEVYGQSENSGPATFNTPGRCKIGTVGVALAGSEVKLASDGEIMIKGPHVFSGYYKNEEATRETKKDGWLLTGDIGEIDANGFVKITDRKKDLLITAGGKNISPQNLEAMLKNLPYVQSAVVVGDAKKYLAALLSPDIEGMTKKARAMGKDEKDALGLVKESEVLNEIKTELEKINQKLAPVEQIKKFSLLPSEFTIDGGEYTPTMKVKRKFVNQKYHKEIESLYQ